MANDGPISQQEMIEMFGEEMPIEAVNLLYGSPPETTARELRGKLREIAASRPSPSTVTDEVERVARCVYANVHHLMRVTGTEAQQAYEQAAVSMLEASGHTALLRALTEIAEFEPSEDVDSPPHTQIATFAKRTARAALSRPLAERE